VYNRRLFRAGGSYLQQRRLLIAGGLFTAGGLIHRLGLFIADVYKRGYRVEGSIVSRGGIYRRGVVIEGGIIYKTEDTLYP